MMRHYMAVLGGLAATAVILSGCSTATTGPTTAASEPPATSATSAASEPPATSAGSSNVLSIATDNPAPMKAVINAFKAANPDVIITTQEAPTGYDEFMQTALAAGTAPDIIRTFPGSAGKTKVGALVAGGALKDLSSSSWVEKMSGTQKAAFGIDGKIYSVPIGAVALGPVYNMSTMKKLGVDIPSTFTQVLQFCAKAKAAGKVAYSQFLKGGSVLLSYAQVANLVYGPNPGFTAEQLAGKQTFAGSGWVKAFELQQQMKDAGCFNDGALGTEWSVAFTDVATGKAAATIAFSDVSGITSQAPAGTVIQIAPMPVDDSGDLYLAVADSSGYGIYSKAKNPELAAKFLDFMATPDGQNAYASTGGAPALPNTTFKATEKNQEVMQEYINKGKTAGWPDQLWVGAETGTALGDVSQGIFSKTMTPKDAATTMDQAWATDVQNSKK